MANTSVLHAHPPLPPSTHTTHTHTDTIALSLNIDKCIIDDRFVKSIIWSSQTSTVCGQTSTILPSLTREESYLLNKQLLTLSSSLHQRLDTCVTFQPCRRARSFVRFPRPSLNRKRDCLSLSTCSLFPQDTLQVSLEDIECVTCDV